MFFCAVTFYMLFIMILCQLRRFRTQQKGGHRCTNKMKLVVLFFFFFCKCYKHQQSADLIKSENSIEARLWHFAIWERKKKSWQGGKKLCDSVSIGEAKQGFCFRDWFSCNQIITVWREAKTPDALERFQLLISFLCSDTAEGFFCVFFVFRTKRNEFFPGKKNSQTANVTKSVFQTIGDAALKRVGKISPQSL